MFRKSLIAVAVTQIAWAGTALAQTAATAPADTGGLAEVTVTAQRREQSLQDVPVTVTAITPVDIQNRQIYSTQDIQTLAPAFKLSNNITTPTNLSLGYRGSTQQDASLIVAESPVGIYVDDIYIARMNSNNVEFPDIDNIEFLQGPQGTLYGRNTEQGALTFHSRTPDDVGWLNFDAGVGNYEQYRTDVSVGIPLGDGWAMSLAGLYNYKNGEWTNIGTGTPWDKEENYGGRAKIHYAGDDIEFTAFTTLVHSVNQALPLINGTTPSDPHSLYTFTSNQVKPTLGYYTIDAPSANYGVATINNLPEGSVDQTINGVTLSYKLGGLTLKSISGFVTTKDTFTSEFAGITPIGTGAIGAFTEIGGEVMNDKEYTQEFQALGKALDDRLDYIGGLYFFRESGGQEFGWYGFGYGPLSNSWISLATDSYAAYGQTTYKITDAFSVTAGLRWTEEKKNVKLAFLPLGALAFPGYQTYPLYQPIHDDLTFAALTPKFGFDYNLPAVSGIDSWKAYIDAERGYKSGGVSGINIFDLSGSQVPYKPEYNWTYEIGLKSEFLDHKVRINADYFLANVSNLVLNETVAVGNGFAFPEVNAGDTRVQGLEMQISVAPLTGLTMYINPAFETGKYTGLNPESSAAYSELPNCAGVAEGVTCNSSGYSVRDPKPPQLPWFSFSSGFDYKYPVAIGSLADSAVLIGADWFKTAAYAVSATGDFDSSPYDRLNGYVGMAVSKELQIRLEAKNIQNRVTINTGSRGLGGFDTLPPREILLTLAYKREGSSAPREAPPPPAPSPSLAPPAPPAPPPPPPPVAAAPPPCAPAPAGFKLDANCHIIEQTLIVRAVDFEFNRDQLTAPARETLDGIARALIAQPELAVEIQGYTDSIGTPAYNLKLSQRRADAVKAYLASRGVNASMLTAKGYGEESPVATNKTAEGRAENRRVAFRLTNAPAQLHVVNEGATERGTEAAEKHDEKPDTH